MHFDKRLTFTSFRRYNCFTRFAAAETGTMKSSGAVTGLYRCFLIYNRLVMMHNVPMNQEVIFFTRMVDGGRGSSSAVRTRDFCKIPK